MRSRLGKLENSGKFREANRSRSHVREQHSCRVTHEFGRLPEGSGSWNVPSEAIVIPSLSFNSPPGEPYARTNGKAACAPYTNRAVHESNKIFLLTSFFHLLGEIKLADTI